ncbi:MAG: RnfABCDGE type electron transport complex subunit D [Gallionellaceae bacterium]|nr:RnfABCDGE type electron transport complex subunit D [Gallionellaceae bacterium]
MIGSPFIQREHNSVRLTMAKVMAALIPGTLAHAWFFGPGIFVSLLVCFAFALLFEGLALLMRGCCFKDFIGDGSVLVTAWLFALSVPPLAPWWLYAVGILFAVVVAKHLYGGLGQNPFNPAMVGYAVLIVSFPNYMTQWPGPSYLVMHLPSLAEAFDLVFAGQGAISADAYTMASPLDTVKTLMRAGVAKVDILANPVFGRFSGSGLEWVAGMYLVGGVLLIANRVITWHVPVAFLAAVAASAAVLHAIDPGNNMGPLFHLLTASVMLGAFFIATDPVSGCATPRGKLIFGALAGFLAIIIRSYGGYPDGVAFSILLMNVAAPFIDAYTQPRVYGHAKGGKVGR